MCYFSGWNVGLELWRPCSVTVEDLCQGKEMLETLQYHSERPLSWQGDAVMTYCPNLERQAQVWRFGLHLNVKKMDFLTTNSNECDMIQINGIDLLRTEKLKHLGSITPLYDLLCSVV
ncbi:hypothetical protein JRQ81_003070 [Phrynocephalus forsythii]|uniref:Uncharacterized protein n=1 Tax=Phrynocephalus forsythii TaxID=171643 RepID=A0A9Q0XJ52_9SAUR|nr:hypothetical protein JRQ81_003070 [Phrynocephalus forsythii]